MTDRIKRAIAIAILELAAGAFLAVLIADLEKGFWGFAQVWGIATVSLSAVVWALYALVETQ